MNGITKLLGTELQAKGYRALPSYPTVLFIDHERYTRISGWKTLPWDVGDLNLKGTQMDSHNIEL